MNATTLLVFLTSYIHTVFPYPSALHHPSPVADVQCRSQLGRERAETMSPARSPPAFFRRGGSNTPPASGAQHDGLQDEEPDETTGIITRAPSSGAQPAMNYQSTVESAGTRARKAGAPARNGADSPADDSRRAGEDRSTSKGRAPLAGAGNGSQNGPGQDHGNGPAESKEAQAWWRSKLASFGSIELENKGSVARDHLALGRQAQKPLARCFCACACAFVCVCRVSA